jgi:hypothetical protein
MLDSVNSGGNTSVIVIPAVLLTGLLLAIVMVYCVGVLITALEGPALTTPMSTALAVANTVVLIDDVSFTVPLRSTSPGAGVIDAVLVNVPVVLNDPDTCKEYASPAAIGPIDHPAANCALVGVGPVEGEILDTTN